MTFWFLHIEVAYQILSAFDCVDFMGLTVYHNDLTRECFSREDDESGDHLKFILSLVLPFGLLWLVITPVAQTVIFLLQKD